MVLLDRRVTIDKVVQLQQISYGSTYKLMHIKLGSQYKNIQYGQLGVFPGPNSQCVCHKITGSISTPHQAVLHSNSDATYHTYYRNSSTNYLTTEMSMKQGYAFGTRIRFSEEIIKTLKMYQLSHYHLF